MSVDQQAPGRDGPDGLAAERMGIGGMSCSFCTGTIRKAFERLEGVEEVGVSLAHEEGLVRYDPERVSAGQLRRTLEDVGFTYRDPDEAVSFAEQEAELATARNRLLVAGGFTAAAFLLMLFDMWLGWIDVPLATWISLALALETMFTVGWFIKRRAWASLRRGILNQHVLLEFAAFAGLAGGLLGVFVNPQFPAMDFFAIAVFVTTYHILSDYASLLVRTRSSQAVRRLMDLQPDTARIVRDGRELEVPAEEVAAGDHVRIRPGESVPVDGVVVEGASAVDESLVTGEPIPADKTVGDETIGGSVNQTGSLLVEATQVGRQAFLSRVARSIEEARALRPGVLQLVDTVLQYFVPGVLAFAALALAGWTVVPWLAGGQPDLFRATFAALAVLVLGYPCALGMATPLAMIRGGGEAADKGILMRSGEAFQLMGELETVVLDKTGTITAGEPAVQALIARGAADERELLRLAAGVESVSEHPLARAIEAAAGDRGIDVPAVEQFRSHTGRGVQGVIDGARVVVGKPDFLTERGVELAAAGNDRTRLQEKGQTVVGCAVDGRLVGLIGIGDAVRPDAAETIERIREAGMTPVMITGDNRTTAEAVARRVGIERVLAGVLPEDKAEEVRRLQDGGTRRVAMVGDGINDAPALTQADVGIAIGAGTDIAIEAADIVVMAGRLGAVMDARAIGMSSYRKTKQNLALAFAFNGVGVPAAATGLVHPVWAMVAMAGSVTLVLANSFAGRLLAGGTREPTAADGAGSRPPGTVELAVDMHCGSCARRITDRLADLEGVRSVHAEHDRNLVTVGHDARVSADQLTDTLYQMGFEIGDVGRQQR